MISALTNQYTTDARTSGQSNYSTIFANQLTNGDIYTLATRNIFNGGTTRQSYKNTGFFFIPVSGDIQTTITRSFSSLLQNLSGHEVSVGATLPTASISGDTHVFDQDVASGLDWLDTDGTTALTSAELGDWAVYNGSKWVKKDFDVSGHSPQLVNRLPTTALSKDGENVFVTDDYDEDNGFDITPQNFTNTEIGGEGYGSRGWYSDPQLDYDVGRLSPDDSEIEDVYLISDTMVLVKTGTLNQLTHITYGSTECALTRGMTNVAVSGPDQRKIDQWGIASGCVPAGDWDDVRFKKSDGTYIPALVQIKKGLYSYLNSDWVESGFYAKRAQPDKDWTIAVEEERPGTRQDKNLPFVASGSNQTTTTPFPGVLRITYNNTSTETELYQRYSVNVPLDGFEDSKAPSVLDIGTINYSLSYFETDAGQAIYRTPKVKSTDVQTSAGTRNGMNVGFLDGTWAGQSATQRTRRTVTKSDLATAVNSARGVHRLPTNPSEGDRVELLNDLTIQGGAVMTAAESAGSTQAGVNIDGLFTGYEVDSRYDNGATGGDLGSLDPVNASFAGLVSFSNARASGSEANKTMFISSNGNTYTPTHVTINGTRYAVGSAVNRDFFPLTGLDGSFLKRGQRYYVNPETATGRLYPDRQLKAGEVYLFDGIRWVKQIRGLAEEEVDSRIDAKVPKQFRSDADITGQLFQPKCWWSGTEAQYTCGYEGSWMYLS